MAKKVSPAVIDKLRSVINDGFKEYDGDIREEALELLADVELIYKTATDNFEEQAKDVDALTKHSNAQAEMILEMDRRIKDQERTIKDLNNSLNAVSRSRYSIDHGTGAMDINVRPNSSVVWDELATALQDVVQTIPPHIIVSDLKRRSSEL